MEPKTLPQNHASETNSNSDVENVLLRVDEEAERSYVRKLDLYLLPFLSLCYFFSAVDRVRVPASIQFAHLLTTFRVT